MIRKKNTNSFFGEPILSFNLLRKVLVFCTVFTFIFSHAQIIIIGNAKVIVNDTITLEAVHHIDNKIKNKKNVAPYSTSFHISKKVKKQSKKVTKEKINNLNSFKSSDTEKKFSLAENLIYIAFPTQNFHKFIISNFQDKLSVPFFCLKYSHTLIKKDPFRNTYFYTHGIRPPPYSEDVTQLLFL